VVAGDAALEVDGASSSLRDRPRNEHNMGSVETDKIQGAGRTAPVVNTSVFDEAPLSIAESSGQTLASVTVSSLPNLPDIGEDDPVMIDISYFTTARILDKRSSPVWSRVQVRARAAMVACRVGERGADGRRSRPELREWTYTSRPSGDIEG
jgi:hypothetical protein